MSATREVSTFTRPDVERILSGLKPFQRRSVDYIFERLYGPSPTQRFLLADEVGLGKTMVAKGVIAKTIDHLWDTIERIDVVYICSNRDIARQNINRLNISGKGDFALASRITLLPIHMGGGCNGQQRSLRDQKTNFVSFTPGTSFDLKSSLGISTERVLLYHLLREHWGFAGAGPRNVLRGESSRRSFHRQLERFARETVDGDIRQRFLALVDEEASLKEELFDLAAHYHRSDAKVGRDVPRRRNILVGRLRTILAQACLHALEPDLIILDEFQRFKHLLADDPDSEAARLAHDLFRYSDEHTQARVLLLSATPYKMYTMGHESSQDDHYADFLGTLRFLLADAGECRQVQQMLTEYRNLIYRLGETDPSELSRVKDQLEAKLRGVMCRTERLAVTEDRSGMLRERPSAIRLAAADVGAYLALQKVARALKHPDTVEYWKSAPFLLNFMENYAIKDRLKNNSDQPHVIETLALAAGADLLLPWEKLRSYAAIDAPNPRLRQLICDTIDCGAWEALWIPPAISYYRPTGVFGRLEQQGYTKRLVFSSWQVVPKTVATLVSYEAERRMISRYDPAAQNTPEAHKSRRRLLEFSVSQGRRTGMPVLGLLYPSFFLARNFDPLAYLRDQPPGTRLEAADVVHRAETAVAEALRPLLSGAPQTGHEDESWYWAAPILLDHLDDPEASKAWWADDGLPEKWLGKEQDEEAPDEDAVDVGDEKKGRGWRQHVAAAAEIIGSYRQLLGRPPADLAKVVAQLAIAGPAVTALRAIARTSGGLEHVADPLRRHMAGRIAFGLRALFNAPDVIALIRGQNNAEPYWRRVLEYSLAGCLQAVLDEYAHVLRESLGDTQAEPEKRIVDIGQAVAAALDLRIANPGVDHITLDDTTGQLVFDNQRLRARFAMRFGDEKDEAGKTVSRADQVRAAFNSPFWPFVLVTTSIGQEGLDFHAYCHAVMHWNLPANPVDMEQREGRVHRYKGHAVRRNVASRHAAALADGGRAEPDPWESLFAAAADEAGDHSGLMPYWIYPGAAFIERHVPALPLSREAGHLPALRNSLAVYRMVFGQPRQDDLVEFLLRHIPQETLAGRMDQLRINLVPTGGSAMA